MKIPSSNLFPGLLVAATVVLVPALAEAHGGGGCSGCGGGGGFARPPARTPSAPSGPAVMPPRPQVPQRPTLPANLPFNPGDDFPLPEMPDTGIAGGSHELAPPTLQEYREWDRQMADAAVHGWDAAIYLGEKAKTAGEWAQWGLNFVPGLGAKIEYGLNMGSGFAEGYAQTLDKGGTQADAVKAGLANALTSGGLTYVTNKIFGGASEHMLNNAKKALPGLGNRMKQTVKATVNSAGYVTSKTVSKIVVDESTKATGNSISKVATQVGYTNTQPPAYEPGPYVQHYVR